VIPNLQHNLDTCISVEVVFSSDAEANSILNALIPDNVKLPKGLSINMSSKESTLAIEIIGKGIPLLTILNTLDEILEHIAVANKVMLD
jgi:transcription factor Pcc1